MIRICDDLESQSSSCDGASGPPKPGSRRGASTRPKGALIHRPSSVVTLGRERVVVHNRNDMIGLTRS